MAGFFEEYRTNFLSAPDEHNVMGLLKNTAENAIAGTAGRYIYYKFAGNFLNNFLGKFFGNYANIGVSAVYSILGQIIATKFVEDQKLSNLIQLAANVPLSDFIAKALGDPLGQTSTTPGQQASGMDGSEAAEMAEVQKLISEAPSVSASSVRGY